MFNASIDGLALWNAQGDVVDSNPAYIGPSAENLQSTSYRAFEATTAHRTPMLYIGGNDGVPFTIPGETDLCDTLKDLPKEAKEKSSSSELIVSSACTQTRRYRSPKSTR